MIFFLLLKMVCGVFSLEAPQRGDSNKNTQHTWGWSGGAKVLGKVPVPGRPTIWMIVGQGPIALAVGAGGGLFGHVYSPLSFLSSFSLSPGGGPI